jgi:5-methylcytosine-specific restriction endonuclease McrA
MEEKHWGSAFCDHDAYICKQKRADGVWIVRYQCSICGKGLRLIAKRDHNLNELPEFDQELCDRVKSEKQAETQRHLREWDERIRSAQAEKEAESLRRQQKEVDWWANYNKYLLSRHWLEMRNRVLERDKHTCQACLRNRAAQVHHLSYALYNKLGRSAAFELISICKACHAAIHPRMEQNFTEDDFSEFEEFESLEYSKPLFASEY